MPAAKKSVSKKVVKKVVKKASPKKVVAPKEVVMPVEPTMDSPVVVPTSAKPMINPKLLRYTLWIVLIALLTYKFGPWLFPARVGYRPISRFEIWNNMEKAYGAQTLDDLVNEKVLDEALSRENVKVDSAKIDEQMSALEEQFKSVGGLDEALKQRGLTRDDLKKQIVTQLSVEEILKDQIEPTDDEVMTEYNSNKDVLYKDKKLEDVKSDIVTTLKDAKLRDAFLGWFADIKKDIPVTNFGL